MKIEWSDDAPYGYLDEKHVFILERDFETNFCYVRSFDPRFPVPGAFDDIDQAKGEAQRVVDELMSHPEKEGKA